MADSQSNKVLKKNNLRSGIELLVPSKVKTPAIPFPLDAPHQTM